MAFVIRLGSARSGRTAGHALRMLKASRIDSDARRGVPNQERLRCALRKKKGLRCARQADWRPLRMNLRADETALAAYSICEPSARTARVKACRRERATSNDHPMCDDRTRVDRLLPLLLRARHFPHRHHLAGLVVLHHELAVLFLHLLQRHLVLGADRLHAVRHLRVAVRARHCRQ
jgi:hypothetical protein